MKKFDAVYVTFRKNRGEFEGHSISATKPTQEYLAEWDKIPEAKDIKDEQANANKADGANFAQVLRSFLAEMSTYRNLVAATISISPMVAGVIANRTLSDFVSQNGTEIADLTNEEFSVFEISGEHFPALIKRHETAVAAIEGAEHLPEIATIGVVSVFDAHLANLLRVVFTLHNEIVLTSDREIKFSELSEFASIEDVKNHIIAKDVEAIIRKSHHEQFTALETKFRIPLKDDLEVWPNFIELCERRNLLTHTGGVVSQQYLKVCEQHGYKSVAKVGDRLVTDAEYFTQAVRIISEIGIKIAHVLWRKFASQEREKADTNLNQSCFDLIGVREYELAARILDLGVNVFRKHASDSTRRMMVVNLANARRLLGKKDEAKKILDKEDWTATSLNFQICVAAVREDITELCKLMKKDGRAGTIGAQDYREWPVFREVRKDSAFKSTFEEVFGLPLVVDQKKLDSGETSPKERAISLENADEPKNARPARSRPRIVN